MVRCPACRTENDDDAVACRACERELPYRAPRSPQWQRILGWVMVWVAFAVAFVNPDAVGFAFMLNSAGWVLFLEDDLVLRVTLGLVIAVVMCQLGVALGERWSPIAG